MAITCCVYGPPGAGKTVNTTRIPGKTLLISSDNSALVLRNFERTDLTVKRVATYKEFKDSFDAAVSKKQYDNIIVDCLTDILDARIVEVRIGGFNGDIRQYYLALYTEIKDMVRRAANCDSNVILNCWDDSYEKTLASGEIVNYVCPALPKKIRNNVLGLCNIVAYVTTALDKQGVKQWYYITEAGLPSLLAKDQAFNRKSCMPQDLFTPPEAKA